MRPERESFVLRSREVLNGKHAKTFRAVRRSVGDEGLKPSGNTKKGRRSSKPKRLTIAELNELVNSNRATPEQIQEFIDRRAHERAEWAERYGRFKAIRNKIRSGQRVSVSEIDKYRQVSRELTEWSKRSNESIRLLRQAVNSGDATPEERRRLDEVRASGRKRSQKWILKNKLPDFFCHVCENITRWARANPGKDPGKRRGHHSRWDDFIIVGGPSVYTLTADSKS